MKRLISAGIFLIFCLSIGFAAENPVDKGSLMVDGVVFFAMGTGDLYENNASETPILFMATPEFGYFVAPGFMIGGMVQFATLSWGNEGVTVFGVGPMLGYFTDKTKDKVRGSVYPYIKGGLLYLNASMENEVEDYGITNLVAIMGLDYMLSDEVALDARIMFVNSSLEVGNNDAESGISIWFGAGFSFFLY